ncbi:MAG: acyltransferase [Phycisphaerales bacterium]|nr:acyltransferase [Phycisphaerales bacterium]
MVRLLAYTWFSLVLAFTAFLPDVIPILRFRGFLVRWCFKKCGKNFQIASGVRITFSTRVELGDDVYIAPACWIQGIGGIKLGNGVMLGPNTVLSSTNHTRIDGSYRFGQGVTDPIEIQDGAWTGALSVITAGTTIGCGAAVAAGSVVTKNVPAHSIVGGVPARVLKENVP